VSAPGLRLTVLTGRHVPLPLPPDYTARLRSVSVTESETERSVFSLSFDAGRSARGGSVDVPGASGSSPIGPFMRVIVELCLGATASVLADGVVTQLHLQPGDGPGLATLAISGEDLSYLLDREQRTVEHPALADDELAKAILTKWEVHGIHKDVRPPANSDRRLESAWVPTQGASDLAHLTELAGRHGFVARMVPGPTRGVSTFYWGPPVRNGPVQPPLSVDLGPETTFTGLSLRTEALAPVALSGAVFDRDSCAPAQVRVAGSQQAPLAAQSLWGLYADEIRQRLLPDPVSDTVAATDRAQAEVERSLDGVTATGVVDGARYGQILRPRALVEVRGASLSYDGRWRVQQVEHDLARGRYEQRVTLRREGLGSTVPRVQVQAAG
jgi:hypothetical protein